MSFTNNGTLTGYMESTNLTSTTTEGGRTVSAMADMNVENGMVLIRDYDYITPVGSEIIKLKAADNTTTILADNIYMVNTPVPAEYCVNEYGIPAEFTFYVKAGKDFRASKLLVDNIVTLSNSAVTPIDADAGMTVGNYLSMDVAGGSVKLVETATVPTDVPYFIISANAPTNNNTIVVNGNTEDVNLVGLKKFRCEFVKPIA